MLRRFRVAGRFRRAVGPAARWSRPASLLWRSAGTYTDPPISSQFGSPFEERQSTRLDPVDELWRRANVGEPLGAPDLTRLFDDVRHSGDKDSFWFLIDRYGKDEIFSPIAAATALFTSTQLYGLTWRKERRDRKWDGLVNNVNRAFEKSPSPPGFRAVATAVEAMAWCHEVASDRSLQRLQTTLARLTEKMLNEDVFAPNVEPVRSRGLLSLLMGWGRAVKVGSLPKHVAHQLLSASMQHMAEWSEEDVTNVPWFAATYGIKDKEPFFLLSELFGFAVVPAGDATLSPRTSLPLARKELGRLTTVGMAQLLRALANMPLTVQDAIYPFLNAVVRQAARTMATDPDAQPSNMMLFLWAAARLGQWARAAVPAFVHLHRRQQPVRRQHMAILLGAISNADRFSARPLMRVAADTLLHMGVDRMTARDCSMAIYAMAKSRTVAPILAWRIAVRSTGRLDEFTLQGLVMLFRSYSQVQQALGGTGLWLDGRHRRMVEDKPKWLPYLPFQPAFLLEKTSLCLQEHVADLKYVEHHALMDALARARLPFHHLWVSMVWTIPDRVVHLRHLELSIEAMALAMHGRGPVFPSAWEAAWAAIQQQLKRDLRHEGEEELYLRPPEAPPVSISALINLLWAFALEGRWEARHTIEAVIRAFSGRYGSELNDWVAGRRLNAALLMFKHLSPYPEIVNDIHPSLVEAARDSCIDSMAPLDAVEQEWVPFKTVLERNPSVEAEDLLRALRDVVLNAPPRAESKRPRDVTVGCSVPEGRLKDWPIPTDEEEQSQMWSALWRQLGSGYFRVRDAGTVGGDVDADPLGRPIWWDTLGGVTTMRHSQRQFTEMLDQGTLPSWLRDVTKQNEAETGSEWESEGEGEAEDPYPFALSGVPLDVVRPHLQLQSRYPRLELYNNLWPNRCAVRAVRDEVVHALVAAPLPPLPPPLTPEQQGGSGPKSQSAPVPILFQVDLVTESGLAIDIASLGHKIAVLIDHPTVFAPVPPPKLHVSAEAYREAGLEWRDAQPLHMPTDMDGVRPVDAWLEEEEVQQVNELVAELPEFSGGMLHLSRVSEMREKLLSAEGWAVVRVPYCAWRLVTQELAEKPMSAKGAPGELIRTGVMRFLAARVADAVRRRDEEQQELLRRREKRTAQEEAAGRGEGGEEDSVGL